MFKNPFVYLQILRTVKNATSMVHNSGTYRDIFNIQIDLFEFSSPNAICRGKIHVG
jgi:hypothetical protein